MRPYSTADSAVTGFAVAIRRRAVSPRVTVRGPKIAHGARVRVRAVSGPALAGRAAVAATLAAPVGVACPRSRSRPTRGNRRPLGRRALGTDAVDASVTRPSFATRGDAGPLVRRALGTDVLDARPLCRRALASNALDASGTSSCCSQLRIASNNNLLIVK
jgi:hypothetical protein